MKEIYFLTKKDGVWFIGMVLMQNGYLFGVTVQPQNIIDRKIDDSIPRTALTSNGNFLICCQEKIICQTKMARIGIHAVSSLNPHPCGFLLNIMQHIRKYHHSSSSSLRNVTIHFSHIKILRLNCYYLARYL